jgi:hypothetical protein
MDEDCNMMDECYSTTDKYRNTWDELREKELQHQGLHPGVLKQEDKDHTVDD